MSSHLRAPLEALLRALSPLTIMGHNVASLDEQLGRCITDAVQALTKTDPVTPPPSDHAYCIGCGTYPKGPYTCATCQAADNYEGEPEHVSDWPDHRI